jgi:hypothetical protein
MRKVARYWWHVCKLAWKETRRDISKAFGRFVAAVVVIAMLVHFGAPQVGPDRIVAIGAVALVALFAFVWKLITIPARLHTIQLSQERVREIAQALEGPFDDGLCFLADSAGGSDACAVRSREWAEKVEAKLRPYDDQERILFATIAFDLRPRRWGR